MPRWAESGIGRLMLRRTCVGSSPKLGGSWSGCGTRTSAAGSPGSAVARCGGRVPAGRDGTDPVPGLRAGGAARGGRAVTACEQGHAGAAAVSRPGRGVRGPLDQPPQRQGRLRPGRCGRLERPLHDRQAQAAPAVDRRGRRRAPRGIQDHRRVPVAQGRHLLVPGLRLRRWFLGAGRGRLCLPDGVQGKAGAAHRPAAAPPSPASAA